jgi:hypothetical protein
LLCRPEPSELEMKRQKSPLTALLIDVQTPSELHGTPVD